MIAMETLQNKEEHAILVLVRNLATAINQKMFQVQQLKLELVWICEQAAQF